MVASLIIASLLFWMLPPFFNKYKEGDLIDDGDIVPPNPPFWEYFTVEGFDEDKDGVRDDVEIWINENYEDPNIRRILKLDSKISYRFMFSKDTEELEGMMRLSLGQYNRCYSFVTSYLSDEERRLGLNLHINSKVYNNFWRYRAQKIASRYTRSGTYTVGGGSIFERARSCPFKVHNMKRLLQAHYDNGTYMNNTSKEDREIFLKMIKEEK